MPRNFDSVNDKRTICEVHREIYDIVMDSYEPSKTRDNIETKLEEAFTMAKKMNSKLRQYKYDYDDGWWEKESELIRNQKHELRSLRKQSKSK